MIENIYMEFNLFFLKDGYKRLSPVKQTSLGKVSHQFHAIHLPFYFTS